MSGKFSIEKDVPLAPFTTLGVGGKALYFLSAISEEQIIEGFKFADAHGLSVFVLGGGSNVLISDAGFYGLVIKIDLRGRNFEEQDDRSVIVTSAAGENWDSLVEDAVNRDLQGIECLSGIPGLVGGTPVQNVGAYGQEVSETIIGVRCLDRRTREIVEFSNSECGFSYRKSIFNTDCRDKFVVLSVKFRLNLAGQPKIVYSDLQKHFKDNLPTLRETRSAVMAIRAAKSMVIDSGDINSKSAGSFFKNPIVEKDFLVDLQRSLRSGNLLNDDETIPFFPAGSDLVKIPAAWLIERAGFQKGFRMGNAAISEKHSLAIVNRGGADANEILALKNRIQQTVLSRFNILLEPEPIFVGF